MGKRNKVAALLLAREISQADIARDLGVTRAYVWNAIRDADPHVGRPVKVAVARKLQCSIESLWPAQEEGK